MGCVVVVFRCLGIMVGFIVYVWWERMGVWEIEREKKKGCDWMM